MSPDEELMGASSIENIAPVDGGQNVVNNFISDTTEEIKVSIYSVSLVINFN